MDNSGIIPKEKYDVCIHVGHDHHMLRKLAFALRSKEVKTYVDDSTRMENCNPSIRAKVIQEAKIAVVSFSEDFANSEWNLEQLNHIVESKQKNNQTVIPVFHHVDRTHVQQLTGKIGAAFAVHEVRFAEEIDKVYQWKNSLRIVANQPGWDVPLTR
ncbi:hypothetical protein TIFTF001_021826 [Ficus carica]|uniref:ADP-ribosyl cyclase/cyclic ADP-ribose hydrolase n=1 Tax=Ficus carica TaxID=3494 RepID=A0AA88AV82_FICCA|nr:hypothetical protein TIFTF001_021826 [Ficus carica]